MTSRSLKIALAASVALNLFAAAAGVTLWVGHADIERRLEAQHRAPRERAFNSLIERLDPAVRDRVRATLRDAARAAHPDFEEARLKRREATALTRSAEFDAARVAALLAESRAAELRGRARLEADAVAVLATLDADDRAVLSEILRRGRRNKTETRAQPPAR